MPTTTVPAIVIRRTYSATPQEVYAAWTDPELMRQFMCPEDVTFDNAQLDVRVGGKYRIVMNLPDSEKYVAYGVYKDVQPAKRLSMTWTWEENDKAEEHETLLTIDLAPNGTGTDLTLTHEKLASQKSAEDHTHGWTSILEKLSNVRG